jgi:hypothetical protein
MITPKSPTPNLLSNLESQERFLRGPYYNRRSRLLTKPVVSKLPGTDTWVCRLRAPVGAEKHDRGFGLTVSEAYSAWKRKQC